MYATIVRGDLFCPLSVRCHDGARTVSSLRRLGAITGPATARLFPEASVRRY